MKNILRKHPETFLAIMAVVFLVALFFSFSWGIGFAVSEVNRAVTATGGGGESVGFNLAGARALNLPGLVK
jgi:hypothetical protein